MESAIAPKRPLYNCPGDPRSEALMLFARPALDSRYYEIAQGHAASTSNKGNIQSCDSWPANRSRGTPRDMRAGAHCAAMSEREARTERGCGSAARAYIPSKANKVRRLGANNARRHAGHSISRLRFRGETQPPRGGTCGITSGRLAEPETR